MSCTAADLNLISIIFPHSFLLGLTHLPEQYQFSRSNTDSLSTRVLNVCSSPYYFAWSPIGSTTGNIWKSPLEVTGDHHQLLPGWKLGCDVTNASKRFGIDEKAFMNIWLQPSKCLAHLAEDGLSYPLSLQMDTNGDSRALPLYKGMIMNNNVTAELIPGAMFCFR